MITIEMLTHEAIKNKGIIVTTDTDGSGINGIYCYIDNNRHCYYVQINGFIVDNYSNHKSALKAYQDYMEVLGDEKI